MMTYEDAERILCNQCIHNVYCMIHDEECEPMKRIKQPQWIPCSERLPEDTKTKIITLSDGSVDAGYYSEENWWCVGDSINLEVVKTENVIAWMSLPPAYKEGEQG